MFPTFDQVTRRRPPTRGRWALLGALALALLCGAPTAPAQNTLNTFSSGSTGADGAFSPTASQSIVVPDSGVFNFTTVNIPVGVTVTFIRNAKNRPVTILASGNVTIAGAINVDGKAGSGNGGGGQGGPGGYDGGSGGYPFDISFVGTTGDGPGGGTGGQGNGTATPGGGAGGGFAGTGANGSAPSGVTPAPGGPRYGSSSLVPLVGGSGGGGGGARTNNTGGAGGGGGGAITIASSGTIAFSGQIQARGGAGSNGAGGGGGGAGGGIRLIANTITGGGSLSAHGGGGGGSIITSVANGGAGGPGFIRVEAFDRSAFAPTANPGFVSFALPHPVAPANAPALRIASVGGIAAPAAPLGSLNGAPDIVVPTTQANPVTVGLEASNVPVGTVVAVTLTPAQGARANSQSTPLSGIETASTATASVTLPAGMSVITAVAVIDLTTPGSAALFMEGERVDRVEVAATFGGKSEVTYVTRTGRRITRPSE